MSEGASPSQTPSNTPTPSETPSSSPSQTPSQTPTQSPSASGSTTATPSTSVSASPSQTPSTTPSASVSPSGTPPPSSTATATPTPSQTPSVTPAPANLNCTVAGLRGKCAKGQLQRDSITGYFVCVQVVRPTPETCNGLDDDCNGLVDDRLPTLRCGTGACLRAVYSCDEKGQPATCTPGLPQPEVCNGVDDDCNGRVDDQDVCNQQVFIVLNVAAAPLPYCRRETITNDSNTLCTSVWSLFALDSLPGFNGSLVNVQVGYTLDRDEPWLLDTQISVFKSTFQAFQVTHECGRAVFARTMVDASSLRPPSARTLLRMQRWQLSAAPTVACDSAEQQLVYRVLSANNPLLDNQGVTLLPIQPVAESCVYRLDELCSVTLGYYNPNTEAVSAAQFNTLWTNQGSTNSLSVLLAAGQYQNNFFLPGRVYNAMTVQWQCAADTAGWMLGWKLMNSTEVSVSAADVCLG